MQQLEMRIRGPVAATLEDVPAMNAVFSEAFTDRYRRDGLVGVRVPRLNPLVWRYAIEDAADGAMVWRDSRGEVVAFNMVHRSGSEGWMGPLAVRPQHQGRGLGKRMIEAGIAWLKDGGASVIGLETMPRTVDNIGFYSALGFVPRHLTVTLTREVRAGTGRLERLSEVAVPEKAADECRKLTEATAPGYDFTRELHLTGEIGLGETSLLNRGADLAGFSLWHACPLAEGRPADELRVLKVVASNHDAFAELIAGLEATGHERGLKKISLRCQTAYEEPYRWLVRQGYQVQWTDLRMTLEGYGEPVAVPATLWSNWEI